VNEAAVRDLRWDGCHNVRDLGGLPTVDGRVTRTGALVRADELCGLNPAGCGELRAHGLRTVLDLRGGTEVARLGDHPFAPGGPHADGVLYRNLPLPDLPDLLALLEREPPGPRPHPYELVLRYGASRLGAIAEAVADASAGGVVMHCHLGQDRTGMVTMLLLDAVGVRREAIVADYALSEVNLAPVHAARCRALGELEPAEPPAWQRSPPSNARLFLHLLDAHGGAAAYLRSAGLSDAALERLRRRLVAEPSE
jgi:hypothetical protein